jgi:hypothetical protein
MLGDSDQDLPDLDGEERDEGDEELPTSPQDLLQELQRARERQQAPSHALGPTQYDPPEPLSEDDAVEGGAPSRFPTTSLPAWPTPPPRAARSRGSSAAAAGARLRPPMPNPGQPGDDDMTAPLPPTPAAAPPRKAAQPSTVPPLPPRSQMRSVPLAGGAFPAWSSFRRRSFWLVPLIFILLFSFLVLLVNPPLSLALLFIFAAIGMLEAAVLFNVSNDAFWVVGIVAGFILMTAVAFFAFFTPIFATLLSILLLALGVVAIRERYYAVKEGTVAVMGLFEKYNRTLQPGFNLRVPGEKVLGIVSTHRERHQVRIPSLTLSTGEHIALDVAMSYQIIPGQEYLAIRNTKDWKEPLQQLLVEVTQDVVSALTFADFSGQHGGPSSHAGTGGSLSDSLDDEHEHAPLARINDRLTLEMRDQAADRGVAIHAVKVHLLETLPGAGKVSAPGKAPASVPAAPASLPPPMAPADEQVIQPPADRSRPTGGPATRPLSQIPTGQSEVAQPPAGTIPQLVFPGQSVPVPQLPATPIAPPPRGGVVPPAAEPTQPPVLSPQALAETYDAVLRRRITDIATIRRIVMQFETVANDPALSEAVPFDAAAGAENLRNHLYQLELQARSQLSSSASEDSVSPSAPQTPLEPDEW